MPSTADKIPISAPATTSLTKCIPRRTLATARQIPTVARAIERSGDVIKAKPAMRNAEKTWRDGNERPLFCFGKAV